MLIGTRFERSTLSSAVFDEAVLAGTNFTGAELRNAKFRQSVHGSGGQGINYVFDQILPIQGIDSPLVVVSGPTFDNATLTGANFDGHPLFAIYPDALHERLSLFGFSFAGAQLEQADFRKAWMFGVLPREDRSDCRAAWSQARGRFSFGGIPNEVVAAQVVMAGQPFVRYVRQCRRTSYQIATAFRGTRGTPGRMPDFIPALLRSN